MYKSVFRASRIALRSDKTSENSPIRKTCFKELCPRPEWTTLSQTNAIHSQLLQEQKNPVPGQQSPDRGRRISTYRIESSPPSETSQVKTLSAVGVLNAAISQGLCLTYISNTFVMVTWIIRLPGSRICVLVHVHVHVHPGSFKLTEIQLHFKPLPTCVLLSIAAFVQLVSQEKPSVLGIPFRLR